MAVREAGRFIRRLFDEASQFRPERNRKVQFGVLPSLVAAHQHQIAVLEIERDEPPKADRGGLLPGRSDICHHSADRGGYIDSRINAEL
ncbi:MAG: hypothetical protein EBT71_03925, partial [Alphaproteobacteria bacterium]|nr:hypothetical protein [Alphaproteobacteria bacterium]